MMALKRRTISLLVTALAIMISLQVYANASAQRLPGVPYPEQRIAEGHVVIVYHTEAQNLDPRRRAGFQDERITTLLYSSLMKIDSNGELYGDLAEEWAFPDPTTLTFKIREDVLFHDGQPLTAGDVKYTLDTVRDPEFASPLRDQFAVITEVEVVGEHELTLHLANPTGALLNSLTLGIVPKHVDGQQLNSNPVGSGPFAFKLWRAQQFIELEAFNGYYGGELGIKRLTIIPVRENTTKVQMLETGEADVVWTGVSAQAARLAAGGVYGVQELPGSIEYIHLNLREDYPWNDVRVRQALLHALDQDAMHHVLYSGFAQKGNNPLIAAMPMFETDTPYYDYDPERAKELLAEAGYANGFTVDMIVVETAIYELVQHYWKEIGVTLNILQREVPERSGATFTGEYEMVGSPFGIRPDPDALLHNLFHSDSMVPNNGRNNGYVNARVDELLDLGRFTPDQEARRAYYSEVQKILTEEVPMLVLGYPSSLLLYNPYLEDVRYGTYTLFLDTALNARWNAPQ